MAHGEHGKSPDAIDSTQMDLEEFLSWLSSSESGHLSDDFADLARYGELIALVIALMSKAQKTDNTESYYQLIYEL